MRDVCDVALVLLLEEARRESTLLGLAAVMAGGEFTDPVEQLREWLAEEPKARPDDDLRRALGLSS